LDSRQQQRYQHANNRDDNEQFDECESASATSAAAI
jgi:hypothetical protein